MKGGSGIYLWGEVAWGWVDGVEGVAVDGVGDALGAAIDINDRDGSVGNGAGEGRGAGRGLRSPVEVRGAKVLGRGDVSIADSTSGKLGRYSLD